MGLSSVHISPRASSSGISLSPLPLSRLSYAAGGSVVRLSGPKLTSRSSVGGKRGKIKLFSRGSQKRLRVLLASVNRDAVKHLPLMVTLTYPAEWPSDHKVWKRHLDMFSKRLAREYPNVAAVWVIEFQQRGAPHFHLMCIGVDRLERNWLSKAWYEVVGSGDEKHLRAGTRVERVRKWNAVQGYVTKYVSKNKSKDLPIPDGIGRWWGVLNRERLNSFISWVENPISLRQFFVIRRTLWRFLKSHNFSITRKSPVSGICVFFSSTSAKRLFLL